MMTRFPGSVLAWQRKYKLDINERGPSGKTALHFAMENLSLERRNSHKFPFCSRYVKEVCGSESKIQPYTYLEYMLDIPFDFTIQVLKVLVNIKEFFWRNSSPFVSIKF